MTTNTPSTSTELAPAKRDAHGRLMERLPSSAPIITSATARSMAEKRWAKARAAVGKGIFKEASAIDPTVIDKYDALGLVAGRHFVNLMESDKPQFDEIAELARLGGMAPTTYDNKQAQSESTVNHVLSLDRDQADAISALLSSVQQRQVIDTEVIPIRSELMDVTGK